MSTRSFVGMDTGSGIYAVYVHHDGYLDGVGSELQEFSTKADVAELIDGGDMSTLGEYYKDRGEEDVDAVTYNTLDEFLTTVEFAWGEWYYIFKDNMWYCGNTYKSSNLYKKLVPYKEAVDIFKAEDK